MFGLLKDWSSNLPARFGAFVTWMTRRQGSQLAHSPFGSRDFGYHLGCYYSSVERAAWVSVLVCFSRAVRHPRFQLNARASRRRSIGRERRIAAHRATRECNLGRARSYLCGRDGLH